ncbi:hypothetical protein [Methylobacterium crusticola]|uniref:hypothetical protein n=1 Tax=Methylobacterium crusticola TaxID=1697972 RepID=UPI000FFB0712|nr:hypothetical protein [Methylobacterium crusticola]
MMLRDGGVTVARVRREMFEDAIRRLQGQTIAEFAGLETQFPNAWEKFNTNIFLLTAIASHVVTYLSSDGVMQFFVELQKQSLRYQFRSQLQDDLFQNIKAIWRIELAVPNSRGALQRASYLAPDHFPPSFHRQLNSALQAAVYTDLFLDHKDPTRVKLAEALAIMCYCLLENRASSVGSMSKMVRIIVGTQLHMMTCHPEEELTIGIVRIVDEALKYTTNVRGEAFQMMALFGNT